LFRHLSHTDITIGDNNPEQYVNVHLKNVSGNVRVDADQPETQMDIDTSNLGDVLLKNTKVVQETNSTIEDLVLDDGDTTVYLTGGMVRVASGEGKDIYQIQFSDKMNPLITEPTIIKIQDYDPADKWFEEYTGNYDELHIVPASADGTTVHYFEHEGNTYIKVIDPQSNPNELTQAVILENPGKDAIKYIKFQGAEVKEFTGDVTEEAERINNEFAAELAKGAAEKAPLEGVQQGANGTNTPTSRPGIGNSVESTPTR
ncbi:MAG: hypothetical protein KDD76_06115, partial [Rickettsiales bacterium]|nr:hypothetical protein [Rickettsiales bacterium]